MVLNGREGPIGRDVWARSSADADGRIDVYCIVSDILRAP